jgi:RHS repeat-associated protein
VGWGRSVTVVAAASAVVVGSATGVLAAPASAPTAEVTVAESLTPVLHGKATSAGTGTQSIHFYARTVGATSWDLLNDIASSGTNAYLALPADTLSIGQSFEYQIAHCDSSGCNPSAVKTGYVSQAMGAGARPGATRVPFTIGDGVAAQVDVGSGNLLLSATAFSLPRRAAGDLPVGVAYNSVTRRVDGHFAGAVGPATSGWRLSTGPDVRLKADAGYGSVVYFGDNGLTGTFLPKSGAPTTYESPDGFKMDLAGDATNGWTLTDHTSGEIRSFDATGRLTDIADRSKIPNKVTFGYDSNGALTEIVTDVGPSDPRTLTVFSTGSGAGRITEISQDGSITVSSGYPAPHSRSVTFDYDGSTRLQTITDAEGRTTSFGYSGSGNLSSVTAPGGAQTSFTYDLLGRVLTVTQPTATTVTAVTRFAYAATETNVADPNSNQAQSILVAAHTRYEYTEDGMLLVAKATDPTGNVREATYTPFLDVETSKKTAGTTTFDHTANDGESLTGVTTATGSASSYGYGNTDFPFQPDTGEDAQSNASLFSYSEQGQFTGAENANAVSAEVTYNDDGTVATSTSASGAVTTYGHADTDGLLDTITPPTGTSLGARSYTWDGFGRLESREDGRNIVEEYSYDDLDRVLEVDYTGTTPSVSYTYDTAGRVATRTDGSGVTTYTYDPLGRLASRINTAGGGLVSYTYDKVGNIATEVDTSGTTSYTYDSRNLVTRTTLTDGKNIDFGYDPDGRRTDTWFSTTAAHTSFAAHTHTDYDGDGRMTRVWSSRASNDADRVSDLSYSYLSPGTGSCATAPPANQPTSLRWAQTNNITAVTTSYCYDHANRLTNVTTPGGDTWAYTYDDNGNRTQTTKNGTPVQAQTPNAADQLTDTGFSYDAAGNATADSANITSATYNGAGQMTGRTFGTDAYSYTYAGTTQNELVSQSLKTGGSRSYSYGRADQNGLPEMETVTVPAGTSRITHDPAGSPLAIKTYSGSVHYYLLDGLGSVIAQVEAGGTITARYSYDPWGEVTSATSPISSAIVTINPYRYAGGIYDPGSKLTHFGQRWYDPTTGRFTQQDSLETLADPSRANRYEYAGSNPINFVDPTGMYCTGVPDGFGSADFSSACKGHDDCYAGGWNRRVCDTQFLYDLEDACIGEYGVKSFTAASCLREANFYYAGVRFFGWIFY